MQKLWQITWRLQTVGLKGWDGFTLAWVKH